MKITQDFFLLVGIISTGKTTALNVLKQAASRYKIPYEPTAITDAQAIIEAMMVDDFFGGYNHTHDWCLSASKGHTHAGGELNLPFSVINNVIPFDMLRRFFTKLEGAPVTGKNYFLEWAGGVNGYPDSDSLAKVDFSYTSAYQMMEKMYLPMQWIERIKGVVHITASEAVRCALNEKTIIPDVRDIMMGKSGWRRSERAMNFFRQDDFCSSGLQELFYHKKVPVYIVENDNSKKFYDRLYEVSDELFG